MSNSCAHEHCRAPKISCHQGEAHLTECPYWQDAEEAESERIRAEDDSGLLPWSGVSFGKIDLQQVAARGRAALIGLVGLHDAGKTTMLALLYLLLCRGAMIDARDFAGSYTLGGWEQRAHYLRLPPGGAGTGFPPHTSLNVEEREAALIHLALRHMDAGHQDILLSDAPGEWFGRWATDREDPSAEGARWLSRKSSGFMLLIDSAALAGMRRGRARARHVTLIQRLGHEAGSRPVAVVWSKADVEVPDSIRDTVRETLREHLEHFEEFAVSLEQRCQFPGLGLSEVTKIVGWVLDARQNPDRQIPVLDSTSRDPLIAYRGA